MLTEDDRALVEELEDAELAGGVVETQLRTDDRVLARISDGIYRQPSSAIRELVANAYDADASKVVIFTDAPRFKEISVRDNGIGMDKEALVRLINHIGGSAKRTFDGTSLGVASREDPSRTPGGRKLIGKIGIGLFSVAQLTREFRIITKKKDSAFRLVADVRLQTYSEDDLASPPDSLKSQKVVTGSVQIRSVPAEDSRSHGTEILLRKIQPAARDLLRSKDEWLRVTEPVERARAVSQAPPRYHIGYVGQTPGNYLEVDPELPWDMSCPPHMRFRALYEAIVGELNNRTSKPKLANTFDAYFRMLWTVALSAPLNYIDGVHPFDMDGEMFGGRIFQLSNSESGRTTEIELPIRERCQLSAPFRPDEDNFSVFIDETELFRPIRFSDLPRVDPTDQAKTPLLFIGKFEPSLDSLPDKVSGGRQFSLEAYFLWTPKVVPVDNNGVLVRIAGASGTLFDETFLSYQIQELTRLQQITAEVFVEKGLDAALNIDRESFNFGHPHAKILAGWVHRALRQVATTQKRIASKARESKRKNEARKSDSKLYSIVSNRLSELGIEEGAHVVFLDSNDLDGISRERTLGNVVLLRDRLKQLLPSGSGPRQQLEREKIEKKIEAIAQMLSAFAVLDGLEYSDQDLLLETIAEILSV